MEKTYVTDDMLDYALSQFWNAMKQYCYDKREIIDLDTLTKQVLDRINNDNPVEGESAYTKALRALDSREAMFSALEMAG